MIYLAIAVLVVAAFKIPKLMKGLLWTVPAVVVVGLCLLAGFWGYDKFEKRQQAQERREVIAKADVVCRANIIRVSYDDERVYAGDLPPARIAELTGLTLEDVESQTLTPDRESVTTYVVNGKRIAVVSQQYSPKWDKVVFVCGKLVGVNIHTTPEGFQWVEVPETPKTPDLSSTLQKMIAAGESDENLGKVARELLKQKSK